MKSIKLHIGCGKDIKEGYENIDLYLGPIKMEMGKLDYPDNCADEILSTHTLEHTEFKKTESVLREWHRVLKPGGVIKVTVPDTAKALKRWLANDSLESRSYGMIWGQQNVVGNYHYTGFTAGRIKKLFEIVGFRDIEINNFEKNKDWMKGRRPTPNIVVTAIK